MSEEQKLDVVALGSVGLLGAYNESAGANQGDDLGDKKSNATEAADDSDPKEDTSSKSNSTSSSPSNKTSYLNILPLVQFIWRDPYTNSYQPANLTEIEYTKFLNLEFQAHYAKVEEERHVQTVIERFPVRVCN